MKLLILILFAGLAFAEPKAQPQPKPIPLDTNGDGKPDWHSPQAGASREELGRGYSCQKWRRWHRKLLCADALRVKR